MEMLFRVLLLLSFFCQRHVPWKLSLKTLFKWFMQIIKSKEGSFQIFLSRQRGQHIILAGVIKNWEIFCACWDSCQRLFAAPKTGLKWKSFLSALRRSLKPAGSVPFPCLSVAEDSPDTVYGTWGKGSLMYFSLEELHVESCLQVCFGELKK